MTNTASDVLTQRMVVFEPAATHALEALARLSVDDLDLPSPCDEWSVRAVILHLADVSDAVIDLVRTGELVLPTPRGADTADPVGVTQERIHALREVIARAGDTGAEADLILSAQQAAANELAVHGWDVATALGIRRPIPDDAAAALLGRAEGTITDHVREGRFAAPISVPATDSPSNRLVAFLGRRPTQPQVHPRRSARAIDPA